MANRTQVCNVEIEIVGTFIFLNARGGIKENTLLLKYQSQARTTSINGRDVLMSLRASGKL